MAIEKVSTILKDAAKHGYGVPAINVFNYETIKWAIQAAQEERYPIIIQFYPGLSDYIPLSIVSGIAKELAAGSPTPVGIHLDHSVSFDQAVSGIKSGFPSVMLDGSSLDFEKNVALTAQVVKTARVFGVEVEGELGHVGSGSNLDDFKNPNNFTSVEEAVRFVEITGVGSLAVSVGNGHGAYIATPRLDFDRMRALRSAVPVSLVLHGCSDIPAEQLQEAVKIGFSKFNIATEYFRTFNHELFNGVDEKVKNMNNAIATFNSIETAVKGFVRNKIRLLNLSGFKI
jgi:ketose-bisphosphate aldolase